MATRLLAGWCLALLSACAAVPAQLTALDTQHDATTNEMVTPLRATAVWQRRMPWRSLRARSLVGLTPVEAQHGGHSQLYLWVSVGTSEQNAELPNSPPVSLRIHADQREFHFPLLVWHEEDQPRALANPLSVPLSHSLRTSLSARDFETIAAAQDITVALISAAGDQADFAVAVDNRNDWRGISEDDLPQFSVEVRHQ